MVEPVTAFNLCLAAINIILNTIPGVIDKGDQIIHYERDRFERYVECLENARQSLASWDVYWTRKKGQTDHDYEVLFGKTGWISIQERKKKINALLENILGHLKLKELPEGVTIQRRTFRQMLKLPFQRLKAVFGKNHGRSTQEEEPLVSRTSMNDVELTDGPFAATFTRDEICNWQVYLRKVADEIIPGDGNARIPGRPSITVLDRIKGVLGKNQQLDRKITDLKDAVDRLLKHSNHCYSERGHGKPDAAPTGSELDQTMQYDTLQRIANEAYASYMQKRKSHEYRLQLVVRDESTSEDELLSTLIRAGTLHFTIFHRPEGQSLSGQEIRLEQLEGALKEDISTTSMTDAVDAILSTQEQKSATQTFNSENGVLCQIGRNRIPCLWTKSLKDLLDNCRDDEALRWTFALERAQIAWKCTLWMILLWKTEWFSNLCVCALNAIMFPGGSSLPIGRPTANSVTAPARKWEYAIHSHGCETTGHMYPRNQSSSNKLYLLGILLAEMCIARPIELEVRNGQLRPVPTNLWATNNEILKHLDQYEHGGNQNPITSAVKFCFRNATEERWQESRQRISDEQIKQLLTYVLRPVHEYMVLVKKVWDVSFFDILSEELVKLADGPETIRRLDHAPNQTSTTTQMPSTTQSLGAATPVTINPAEDLPPTPEPASVTASVQVVDAAPVPVSPAEDFPPAPEPVSFVDSIQQNFDKPRSASVPSIPKMNGRAMMILGEKTAIKSRSCRGLHFSL